MTFRTRLVSRLATRLALSGAGIATLLAGFLAAAPTAAALTGLQIRNENSGLCLAARQAPGENPVVQVQCDSRYEDQRWFFVYNGGGNYHLANVWTNKCIITRYLNVESKAVAGGCDTYWQYDDQKWQMNWDGDVFHLKNRYSGLCLVVRGTARETQALQSTCGRWADQYWRQGTWG